MSLLLMFFVFCRYVHDAGGLCVVDEIQTGFGRAGDFFWVFESQGMPCTSMYIYIYCSLGNFDVGKISQV